MRSNQKVSKFCYSDGNFRIVNIALKKLYYYLLACTCAPLLFGSSVMASTPVRQDIAQVISAGNVIRPSLKPGSKGNAVNELQAALKLLGFYNGVVNGEYDNATATSVSQFRQAAGLPADNSVDERVWQRLFPSEPIANNSSLGSSITPPQIPTNPFPVPTQTVNPPILDQNIPNQNIMSVVNPAPEPRPAIPTPQNTQRSSISTTIRSTNNNNTQRSSTSTTIRSTNNNTSQRSSTSTSTRNTSPAPKPSESKTPSTSPSNQRRPANRQVASFPKFTQKPNIQYTSEGRPILRPGMRGEEVTFLQQRLRVLGYLSIPADGYFGTTTESAVKALQKRFDLESDGVVGGATWNFLLR